jgi:hypothetical protein
MSRTRALCLLLIQTILIAFLPSFFHPPQTTGDAPVADYVGFDTVDFVAAPAQPRNLAPAHGAIGVSLTPTLRSSTFSESEVGDTHVGSQWRLWKDSTSIIYDSGTDFTKLTTATIDSGRLSYSTTYWWHVRHRGSMGLWSDWSAETSFETTAKGGSSLWIWIVVVVVAVLVVGAVAYVAATRRVRRVSRPRSKPRYRITP